MKHIMQEACGQDGRLFDWLHEVRGEKVTFESLVSRGIWGILDSKLVRNVLAAIDPLPQLREKINYHIRESQHSKGFFGGRAALRVIHLRFQTSEHAPAEANLTTLQRMQLNHYSGLEQYLTEWQSMRSKVGPLPSQYEAQLLVQLKRELGCAKRPDLKFDLDVFDRLPPGDPSRSIAGLIQVAERALRRLFEEENRNAILSPKGEGPWAGGCPSHFPDPFRTGSRGWYRAGRAS